MSNAVTKKMLEVYQQLSSPVMFLAGMFRAPAGNFHESEEVEIDVVRSGEDVAVAIQDLSAGYRNNSTDVYTNKAFKPPVFKESIAINSHDLLKRSPGENPFASSDLRAKVIGRLFQGMTKVEAKIRRAIELQASQILQTGILNLVDENGVIIYTLDFKPKGTHMVTAGTAWSNPAADIIRDLMSLGNVIQSDGLAPVDQAIFGDAAWEAALKNSAVQKRFDMQRADLGTISAMQMMGNGGQYRGTLEVGTYKLDVWTYGARFKHPQTGVSTPYVTPGKVILRASSGRLDASFGAVPNIGRLLGAQNLVSLPELPTRISLPDRAIDLNTNVWVSPDGETLFGGVASRPLLIPTAIDTFGCLTTGV